MPLTAREIVGKLRQALDGDCNVQDEAAVLEVLVLCETCPITKDDLEQTRLGRYINDFRRKTTNQNLAKRAKQLVRQWQSKFTPPNKAGQGQASPGNYSPAVSVSPALYSAPGSAAASPALGHPGLTLSPAMRQAGKAASPAMMTSAAKVASPAMHRPASSPALSSLAMAGRGPPGATSYTPGSSAPSSRLPVGAKPGAAGPLKTYERSAVSPALARVAATEGYRSKPAPVSPAAGPRGASSKGGARGTPAAHGGTAPELKKSSSVGAEHMKAFGSQIAEHRKVSPRGADGRKAHQPASPALSSSRPSSVMSNSSVNSEPNLPFQDRGGPSAKQRPPSGASKNGQSSSRIASPALRVASPALRGGAEARVASSPLTTAEPARASSPHLYPSVTTGGKKSSQLRGPAAVMAVANHSKLNGRSTPTQPEGKRPLPSEAASSATKDAKKRRRSEESLGSTGSAPKRSRTSVLCNGSQEGASASPASVNHRPHTPTATTPGTASLAGSSSSNSRVAAVSATPRSAKVKTTAQIIEDMQRQQQASGRVPATGSVPMSDTIRQIVTNQIPREVDDKDESVLPAGARPRPRKKPGSGAATPASGKKGGKGRGANLQPATVVPAPLGLGSNLSKTKTDLVEKFLNTSVHGEEEDVDIMYLGDGNNGPTAESLGGAAAGASGDGPDLPEAPPPAMLRAPEDPYALLPPMPDPSEINWDSTDKERSERRSRPLGPADFAPPLRLTSETESDSGSEVDGHAEHETGRRKMSTSQMLNKLHNTQWPGVNGSVDPSGQFHGWQETYLIQSPDIAPFVILPYADIHG